MRGIQKVTWTCSSCLRAQGQRNAALNHSAPHALSIRAFRTATRLNDEQKHNTTEENETKSGDTESEKGALSRRLSEMAEDAMNTGSKSDRKTMADAGFSEELKRKLEERIAQASFASENQKAMSEVNMPVSHTHGSSLTSQY